MSKEAVDVEIIDLTSPDVGSTDADQATHEPGNLAEARDDPETDESQRVEPSQDSPPGLLAGSTSLADVSKLPATAAVPLVDPCAAFTTKRVAESKVTRIKDVGAHVPSMVDFEPLLAKHAAGTLSFQDTIPIQKHDKREVVGWLHMATDEHTKAIHEDAAMVSLLLDNQSMVKADLLVDIIKCERDIPNRMLRLCSRWSPVFCETIVPSPSCSWMNLSAGEYVTCSQQHKGAISHLEVPLDDLIAEIEALESQGSGAISQHHALVEAAVRHSEFDLAKLVNDGRVDTLCSLKLAGKLGGSLLAMKPGTKKKNLTDTQRQHLLQHLLKVSLPNFRQASLWDCAAHRITLCL
ncbi:Aste57867_9004 [Aphanomyces stellatus]|uniref:Aste57867_9004 protein n=1 Tax=Aphanomyces stellatus TaxID=120398 RepID=A0A485KLU0_9STRA|nr:hypothetical protein As57867_008969 [Aphanomyces stellatus]VFT85888.1 Aste57867_9004 [Aphanomyces stellatus]